MDLPPSNSFCRMLTHRLADYYHMTHSYEPATQSVRIFRTPFCRIPPSLSSIVASQSNNSSPAPVVMPRKIMRRGEDGDPAPVSATPSKPTSEAGSESKESKVAREKYVLCSALCCQESLADIFYRLTREEREEAYKQARQRIFGSAEKTEGGEKGMFCSLIRASRLASNIVPRWRGSHWHVPGELRLGQGQDQRWQEKAQQAAP
jgi:hypothetical protein